MARLQLTTTGVGNLWPVGQRQM